MKEEGFIYRKSSSVNMGKEKLEEISAAIKDEDEKGILIESYGPSNVDDTKPLIISLGEISYHSDFFINVHPFIFYGYRIHHSYTDCLKSLFVFHNETSNIWTHVISFIGFLALLIVVFCHDKYITISEGAIVFLYIISSILCFLFSSMYHTFGCHSEDACKAMFKIDLFGITFQLLCGTICGIHYMFHDFETLRYMYFSIFVILSILAIVFTVFPVFVSEKFAIVRMLIFASLFLLAFLSCIHWTVIARIEEVEIISKFTLCAFSSVFTGFIFYLSKFPESVYQSKFVDHYIQSHTLWHICVTISTISYYLMLYNYNIILIMQQKHK